MLSTQNEKQVAKYSATEATDIEECGKALQLFQH